MSKGGLQALSGVLEQHFGGQISALKEALSQVVPVGTDNGYSPTQNSLHCWRAVNLRKRIAMKELVEKRKKQQRPQEPRPEEGGAGAQGSMFGNFAKALKKAAKSHTADEVIEFNKRCQKEIKLSTTDRLFRVLLVEAVGLPDCVPFCRVSCVSENKLSKDDLNQYETVSGGAKTNAVIWNETFCLASSKPVDVILFEVFDRAAGDAFLGWVAVPFTVLPASEIDGTDTQALRWYSLLDRGGVPSGKGQLAARITGYRQQNGKDDEEDRQAAAVAAAAAAAAAASSPSNGEGTSVEEFSLAEFTDEAPKTKLASPGSTSSVALGRNTSEPEVPADADPDSDEEEDKDLIMMLAMDDESKPITPLGPPPSYPQISKIGVWTGTWNVGKAAIPTDLSAWIPDGFDLYAVAVQECKYHPREDLTTCRDDFLFNLTRHFGRDFSLVKYHSLWEIRLCIFVRNKYFDRITGVRFHNVPTGVGNVLGNKGGVVTSLNFGHTSLCFVSAHLAAHQEFVAARNKNYSDIVKASPGILSDFDHVFILGDLNYRLNWGDQGMAKSPTPAQFQEMVSMIEQKKFKELFETDQLICEQRAGRVLVGFSEGDCTAFPPTFKNTRRLKLGYHGARSPAWTDRILWKSHPALEGDLNQLSYTAAMDIFTSDHRPVLSTWALQTVVLPPALDLCLGKCTIAFSDLRATNLPKSVPDEEEKPDEKDKKKGGIGFGKKAMTFVKQQIKGKETNPFLRITAPYLYIPLLTSVKKNTTSPVWADGPPSEIKCNSPLRLCRTPLTVEVLSQSELMNSLIGVGTIWIAGDPSAYLGEARKEHQISCAFFCSLLYNGLASGTLEGRVIFRWEKK